jgi:hypothetical protein
MIILAVDPGLTTGMALFNTITSSYKVEQITGFEKFSEFMSAWCDGLDPIPDVIVVEKYTITPETAKKTQQYEALEITGVLRHLVHEWGSQWVEPQLPSAAMKLGTNDRLKRVGWYVKGKPHAMDAARHLFLWCCKNGIIQFSGEGLPVCLPPTL